MRNVFVYQEGDKIAKLIADDLRAEGHDTTVLEKGAHAPPSTIPIVSYIPTPTEQRNRAALPAIHHLRKGEVYGNIKEVPAWLDECDEWILVEYSPLQIVAWIAHQIATTDVPASAAA